MTRLPQLPANELESVDDAGIAFRIMRMKEGPMMTKLPALPANYYEAFADDWIVEHRKPNGVFHVDAEEIYGKELMKHWMRQCPGFGPDDVFYFAENGNEQAHNALVEMYAEYRQRREDPPVSVEAYAIRVLNNGRKKPGPGRAALFVRDIGIMLLVEELHKRFNLGIHHNPASKRPTATSIAADRLSKAGIGILMGAKAVAKIHNRYAPTWTGKFPAGYLGIYG